MQDEVDAALAIPNLAGQVDEDETIDRIDTVAEGIGERVGDLGGRMLEEGLDAENVGRLVERIGGRARACRKLLAAGA